MKVVLLGHTRSYVNEIYRLGMECEDVDSASNIIEFGGRTCYESYGKPNPTTSARRDYIANLIRSGHTSVLEHGSVTFHIEGVSRSLTHELVRHRIGTSYSQKSQRYCSESDARNAVPKGLEAHPDLMEEFHAHAARARHLYRSIYKRFREDGVDLKTARGRARSVLLESTETHLVVTYNLLAWRHFLNRRGSLHAEEEIRALAVEIYRQLDRLEPEVFQDFAVTNDTTHGEYLERREL